VVPQYLPFLVVVFDLDLNLRNESFLDESNAKNNCWYFVCTLNKEFYAHVYNSFTPDKVSSLDSASYLNPRSFVGVFFCLKMP
jgi:hypothetical protein